jgi:WD40 repeat protein/tRNA A-37 threonylcarbamoyl transferase component Bud32
MPVTEAHPSAEDLAAFTLGTLDDEREATIESHVAACMSCQERAAVAPGDTLVELLRRVHARTGRGADTFVQTAARVETPVSSAAVDESVPLASAVAPSTPAESDCPEVPESIPPELVRHERYRVVQLLGTGGMGAVYEAEHLVMQRSVALKVIRRAYTAKAGALERFRREVRTAARLSHPNIVHTYDAEDAGETHFLVMEYVEGTDLGRLVQERGPLPVDRACDYVRQAALGLQYAVEQGMVHRDLKPHNLMLTPDGRVKILDFGLARFACEVADAADLTSTGLVLGTVDYIAPEQADNAHRADIRSDIYSLGCTLYHLIAGQPPFPTGTPLQKVMAHVKNKPRPVTELRDDLPEELMPVLERMMAKNPKHRYQTPAEVAFALEPFTRATGVARAFRPRVRATDTDHTVVLDRTPGGERRRPRFALAVAILAFFVAGLLGVGVYRIVTDKGELVIQTENDDVEVVVSKGGEVVKIIDTTSGKHVTLNSGVYELALKDGPERLTISPGKMTLKRGKTVLATITRRKPDDPLAELPRAGRPPDGVVAWWRADGNARDSVGGNHGTLKGGVKFVRGVAGQAFDFNGINGRIDMGNAPSLHLSSRDFSVSAWVNFRSLKRPPPGNPDPAPPGDMWIVGKMSLAWGSNADGWGLLKQDDNHFWFGFGGGNTNGFGGNAAPTMIRSTTSVVPGVWYHVVAVKTAAHFSLYVNGIEEASKPLPAFKDTNTADLLLGHAAGNSSHMNGLIDEVTVYSRALSPAEVKARWRALAPATKPGAEGIGEVRRFLGHTGDAHYVAYSRDGRYAVSGSGWPIPDFTIRLWDVSTGKQIRQFNSADGRVLCVAFSPDGRRILYGTGENADHPAILFDVATGKEVRRFVGHGGDVYAATFSPNGRKVLSASLDGTARVWDADTGKELCKFEGHKDRVMGAVFSPDGKRAVSGALDNTIYLWDVETGEKVQSFEGNKGGVHSVAISPDGQYVLSGSWSDNTLRLWEVATGKLVREFIGHEGGVPRVAFSSDGRRAISGSTDKTVRLWDVATGKELHCFTGHTDTVWGVAFSPDDRYALSASQDKTLRLWRLPEPPPAKEKP